MSRAIIFCGFSGSGKTTLAQAVSKKLNTFLLSKDALKEQLYELEGGKTLEDSQRTGKQAILLILDLAESNLQNGVDVVLESPFNHPDNVERFRQWVDKYGVDLRVVICEVNEEERFRRIKTRPRHHSHHDDIRLQLGHHVKDTFDYSAMPEKKLFLETNKPVEVLVDEVLRFLQS